MLEVGHRYMLGKKMGNHFEASAHHLARAVSPVSLWDRSQTGLVSYCYLASIKVC